MDNLHLYDWLIIAAYVAVTLFLGLAFRKRASKSSEEYFLSGRTLARCIEEDGPFSPARARRVFRQLLESLEGRMTPEQLAEVKKRLEQ